MRKFVAAAALTLGVFAFAAPAIADSRIVALSEHDEALYREAFALAERGDMNGARNRLSRVEDEVLVGTALGHGHLQANRRTYAQVVQWLRRYPDLAISDDVYRRAVSIRPRRGQRAPSVESTRTRPAMYSTSQPEGDSSRVRAEIARLQEAVSMGRYSEAREIGASALSGPRSGQAAWLLGLVAFRERDYARAIQLFEQSAAWLHHDRAQRSAVHFWAARAHLASGNSERVLPHLESAARTPTKFYGQLAEVQLGRDSALDFRPRPVDGDVLRRFIERHPEARRAAALAQLGRLSDVEDELRRLHGRIDASEDVAFLGLAQVLAAPSAQLRAADYGGPELAAGYCPETTFTPNGGFTLDRALVYAVVRQESYYNPVARSVSNARGLMQLLPSTANDLDRAAGYRRNPEALYDPNENLRLGQRYIEWLMDQFHRDGDLARVFAAYNGGPGWLSRWLQSVGDIEDPLLLLELLPRAESRDYAERVLSHMAMCRQTYGQPPVEMQALAQGRPATYQALDQRGAATAAAGL